MFKLRILQWLIYLPAHIVLILSRYPLAPLAVLLFSTADKRHLRYLQWLETLDNDLAGDSGWQNEHIQPGSDPLSDWNRIKWLWRNGGNAVNYRVLGIRYPVFGANLVNQPIKSWLWVRSTDGYWLIRKFIPLFGRYLEIFIGWGLFGEVQGRCKFSCTIRVKRSVPV